MEHSYACECSVTDLSFGRRQDPKLLGTGGSPQEPHTHQYPVRPPTGPHWWLREVLATVWV